MIKEILKIKNVFNISRSKSSTENKQPKDLESFRKFLDLARFEMDKNGLFDWKLDPERVKDGKIVNKDFHYSSDTNTDWMSSNQLKNWVNKNLDIFK